MHLFISKYSKYPKYSFYVIVVGVTNIPSLFICKTMAFISSSINRKEKPDHTFLQLTFCEVQANEMRNVIKLRCIFLAFPF